MSSPVEWARDNNYEEKFQIGELAIKAHQLRLDGRYVEEGEHNTEIYKLICKVLGKVPYLSNRSDSAS